MRMHLRRAACQAICVVAVCAGAVAAADPPPAGVGSFLLTATPEDILGAERAELFTSVMPADETIAWEVVVADSYTPKKPAGLLVYVSPSNSGKLPRGWKSLLDEHNLIWVAANASGNRVAVSRRMGYAVFAPALIGERYEVDESRVFLSGFSGGARVSGLLAAQYPSLFRGAVYIGGAETWDEGTPLANLERMRTNRFVFLVGSEDANRAVAREVQSDYEAAGMLDNQAIVVRRMGHVLPEAREMHKALVFIDASRY